MLDAVSVAIMAIMAMMMMMVMMMMMLMMLATSQLWLDMAHKAITNVVGTTAVSRGQDPLQAQYTWIEHNVIGSGTFGKVVAGTRRVDGRNYALKHVDTTCAEWQLEYQLLSGMGIPM